MYSSMLAYRVTLLNVEISSLLICLSLSYKFKVLEVNITDGDVFPAGLGLRQSLGRAF